LVEVFVGKEEEKSNMQLLQTTLGRGRVIFILLLVFKLPIK
jgi:hypothetical protein